VVKSAGIDCDCTTSRIGNRQSEGGTLPIAHKDYIMDDYTNMSVVGMQSKLAKITYSDGIRSGQILRECLKRLGYNPGDSLGELFWMAAFELLMELKRRESADAGNHHKAAR